MNLPHERCFSRVELADLLGVSMRTVGRMDRAGTGPRSIRPGRRTVRYPASGVAEYLEAASLDAPPEVRAGRDGSPLPITA